MTIEITSEASDYLDMALMLEHIAELIGDGFSAGVDPNWKLINPEWTSK